MRLAPLAVLALLTACGTRPPLPLPDIHPAGPMAEAALQANSQLAARAWVGWMIVFEARGQLDGYTPAEKFQAARVRTRGEVCPDYRNLQAIHDGNYHLDLVWPDRPRPLKGCVTQPSGGGPGAKDFEGVAFADLKPIAERLGLTCEARGAGSSCKVSVEYDWQKGTPQAAEEARTLTVDFIEGEMPKVVLVGKNLSAD